VKRHHDDKGGGDFGRGAKMNMENDILQRLERMEAMLDVLVERQLARKWYSTEEFAQAVGKAEFTIREYCRQGRLRAEKRQSGRGAHRQWALSHAELERYRRYGLFPIRKTADRVRDAGGGAAKPRSFAESDTSGREHLTGDATG
jgi:hypothetical protein